MGADLLEFVVKIKDLVSMASHKMGGNVTKDFAGMEAAQNRFQSKLTSTSKSVSQLNSQLEQLTKKRDLAVNVSDIARANREIQAVERRVHRLHNVGVNQPGGNTLRMPTFMKAAAIGAGLLMGGQYVAKAGANAQRDLIGLTTFLGKDKANSVYTQLQQDAATTPFGTKSLLMVDRALISAGVNADRARRDMLALANAVSAVGGGDDELMRMAENMRQIRTKGKAELEDIKQFGNVGIGIYQLLAAATGKTLKQVSHMAVSYDLLSFALRKAKEEGGLYAHAMENQGKSIYGKWSTLLDNIEIAAAKIGLSQSNAITGLIDQLISVTDRLPALAKEWAPTITGMVKGVISLTQNLISMAKWVYHNWGWLKYLAGVVLTFKAAMWLTAGVCGVYNSIMSVAAIRTTLFAAAETRAVAATTALNTAMMAGPWGWVLAGITLLGIGITAWATKTKATANDLSKGLPREVAGNLSGAEALAEFTKAGEKSGQAFRDGIVKVSESYKLVWDDKSKSVRLKEITGLDKVDNIDYLRSLYYKYPAITGKGGITSLAGIKEYVGVGKWVNDHRREIESIIFPSSTSNSTNSKNDLAKSFEEQSQSIIGGGARVINISFRNVVEHMQVVGDTINEQAANWEEKVEIAMARIFKRLPTT